MIVVLLLAGRGGPAGEAAEWLCVHPGRMFLEYASAARSVAVLEADGVAPRRLCGDAVVLRAPSAAEGVRVALELLEPRPRPRCRRRNFGQFRGQAT